MHRNDLYQFLPGDPESVTSHRKFVFDILNKKLAFLIPYMAVFLPIYFSLGFEAF